MAAHTENTITSMTSLRSSIETDKHVFRWFMYVVTRPAVLTDLIIDKNARELYDRLKRAVSYQRILCVFLLCLLLSAYFSKKYLILLCSAVILYVCVNLHLKIKKLIIEISVHLLARDYQPSQFGRQTLYQIGEFYARKYNIKSLVSSMTSVDSIMRRVVFGAWMLLTFIIPLSFFQFWILIICIYFIAYAIVHLSLIYNRLK